MKRKIAIFLSLVLMILCFAGCKAEDPSPAHQTLPQDIQMVIQRVTIRYRVDGENYKAIRVDFRSGEKTVTDYIGSTSEKSTQPFDAQEKLLELLNSTVIPAITDSPDQGESSAEEQIAWSVQIVTDTGNLRAEGFGNAQYPDYWDTLLSLLGA